MKRKFWLTLDTCEACQLEVHIVIIVQVVDADYRAAFVQQTLGNMETDKTGRAGDQYLHLGSRLLVAMLGHITVRAEFGAGLLAGRAQGIGTIQGPEFTVALSQGLTPGGIETGIQHSGRCQQPAMIPLLYPAGTDWIWACSSAR